MMASSEIALLAMLEVAGTVANVLWVRDTRFALLCRGGNGGPDHSTEQEFCWAVAMLKWRGAVGQQSVG